MRLLDVGDDAVLVELDDLSAVLALFRALDAARPLGVEDLVPAARTVLVRFDRDRVDRDEVRRWLRVTTPAPEPVSGTGETVDVDVAYDGPDLADVGALTGLGVDGVVAAHTGAVWTVAFVGFAPGFGYLVGGPETLQVPRRATPRTAVPAGAVGLAGEFSGVYPRSSPCGWQLIGRTDAVLWAPDRHPPALLRPGVTVRFHAT